MPVRSCAAHRKLTVVKHTDDFRCEQSAKLLAVGVGMTKVTE
jgi:hypothetical protein